MNVGTSLLNESPRPFLFVTINPQFVASYFKFGLFARAAAKNLIAPNAINLRDFAIDNRGSIDDQPFGGGDSMIMRPEPLVAAIKSIGQPAKVIVTGPKGKIFHQEDAQQLAASNEPLLFICGRFGGIDQRFLDRYAHLEYSIGDYVVSGGELPTLTIADAIIRQIPGSLGNPDSATQDSFGSGFDGLLEPPLYTRPRHFEGDSVPDVLLSGDHKAIANWRCQESLKLTRKIRPDLLKQNSGYKTQSTTESR